MDVSQRVEDFAFAPRIKRGSNRSEMVSTFLGAHVVPAEYRGKAGGTAAYVVDADETLIPEVAERKSWLSFAMFLRSWSIFAAKIPEQVLEAGERKGLLPRIHAEQLTRTGATQLADAAGRSELRSSGAHQQGGHPGAGKLETVATLMPGCDFHLGLKQYAPARALIDAGARRCGGDRLQSRAPARQ